MCNSCGCAGDVTCEECEQIKRREIKFCGGKRCYTKREANEVLHKCRYGNSRNFNGRRKKSASKVIPKRKYPCKICGMYHLTKLPGFKE